MDSLDAALRRAEKCIAGGKDEDHHADVSVEHAVEPNVDDSGVCVNNGFSVNFSSAQYTNDCVISTKYNGLSYRMVKKRALALHMLP